MRRAIKLAQRGEGRVEPNPMVGCVIARHGKVLGQGFHRRFGGPHAEIVALRSCAASPRGATVYVTLEPCCHYGQTPPCVDALIDAGVTRVVVGVSDPNPRVAGRGLRKLRAAGMEVRVAVEKEAATALIAPFATLQTQGRPYVIAKWAQGADGCLVTPRGRSPRISCPTSLKFAHRLRARVDAILVGSRTVIADDPLLTPRGVAIRRVATRVVLDGNLRMPPRSNLVRTAERIPTLVVTTPEAARSPKAKRLAAKGVEITTARRRKRGLDLADVMQELAARAMTNVLVEGGPTLLDSFFRKGFVDEAHVIVAPRDVGSPAWSSEQGRVHVRLDREQATVCRSGVDRRYHWRFSTITRG